MNLPNITPEVVTEQKIAADGTIEQSPIAEFIPVSPVQPSIDTPGDPVVVTTPPVLADTDIDETISSEEISNLTSSDTGKADDNWIGRVRDIIKNDEGQPYKEEADAEVLYEEYMKDRFNVDVDAPIEEK
jgi:hypothetical protein